MCAVFFYQHDYVTTNHVHLHVIQQLENNQSLASIFDTVSSGMTSDLSD